MISSIERLNGYAPTLPTPFDDNEALDLRAFGRTCELQSPPLFLSRASVLML
jgi:hypothetical protein